ncbi:diaminobutyrate acetyltransferase [Actinokineospora pegani]|uniref:diaminobutyrate acetyltransferase n=1 Tax=Actinokineospora pegani TaxID=2654637 RepID=UPI0012E9EF0C|nr:diaminobutyrate acetyltransferase [Actinokineospora pegani]
MTKNHSIERPSTEDGSDLWRVARDSRTLDLNSSYAYLLWCRDFADTSLVVKVDGAVVGFVIGFIRPTEPETVVVWQIAVDADQRGRGLAAKLLDRLAAVLVPRGVRNLETTISPDNAASIALFTAFARRQGAAIDRTELFGAGHFPDAHEAEDLYRIGPLEARVPATV